MLSKFPFFHSFIKTAEYLMDWMYKANIKSIKNEKRKKKCKRLKHKSAKRKALMRTEPKCKEKKNLSTTWWAAAITTKKKYSQTSNLKEKISGSELHARIHVLGVLWFNDSIADRSKWKCSEYKKCTEWWEMKKKIEKKNEKCSQTGKGIHKVKIKKKTSAAGYVVQYVCCHLKKGWVCFFSLFHLFPSFIGIDAGSSKQHNRIREKKDWYELWVASAKCSHIQSSSLAAHKNVIYMRLWFWLLLLQLGRMLILFSVLLSPFTTFVELILHTEVPFRNEYDKTTAEWSKDDGDRRRGEMAIEPTETASKSNGMYTCMAK